ncbi:MAG: hypothetical protein ACYC3X_18870 [Pirellulaceae bacterium]
MNMRATAWGEVAMERIQQRIGVFEFGRNCKQTDPPPPPKAAKIEDYWNNPNDLAWHVFPDPLMYYEPGKLGTFVALRKPYICIPCHWPCPVSR